MTKRLLTITIAIFCFFQSKGQFQFDEDVYLGCVGQTFTLRAPTGPYYSNYSWWKEGLPVPLGSADTLHITNIDQFDNFYIVQADSAGVTLYDTTNLFGFVTAQLDLGDDQTGCMGDTITITDSYGPGGIYEWNTPHVGYSIKTDTSGLFICTKKVTTINPCVDIDTVEITIFEHPQISAGEDTSLCTGSFIQLDGEVLNPVHPPYSFAWSPNIEINDTTAEDPFLTTQVTRTYHLRVEDGTPEHCASFDSVTITYFPPLASSTPFEDTTICEGASITLGVDISGGTPGYIYNWNQEITLDDPDSPTPVATPVANPTEYIVLLKDTMECFKYDTIVVYLNAPTADIFNSDTTKCNADTIHLSGQSTSGTAPFTYQWEENGNPLSTDSAVSTILEGTITLIVTDSLNCESTDEITVTNNNLTLVSIDSLSIADSLLNTQELAIAVHATGDDQEFSWSHDGAGTILSTSSSSTSYSPGTEEEALVIFTVEVSNSCSADTLSDTTVVYGAPKEANVLFIPNVVIPAEADVDVNTLRIYSTTLTSSEFSFQIFNRNGVVVFETTSLDTAVNTGWGGVSPTGDNMEAGVYSYVLKGLFDDGESVERVGSFTLVR